MQAGVILDLMRSRPTSDANKVKEDRLFYYNGRMFGHDYETEGNMPREKMQRLDTGRVIAKDLKWGNSRLVSASELVPFRVCGPPVAILG